MTTDRIVCLANSYKHGHRCVAGISLRNKRWVRLVGKTVPGCLTVREASYPDGTEVELGDVFEVELEQACASNYHPENFFIGCKSFYPIRRFEEPNDIRLLMCLAAKGPPLMHGYSDRLPERRFEEKSIADSLELMHPEDLWWWVREERGKLEKRALFRFHQVRYDLSVTDPVWLEKLHRLKPGIYPHVSFQPTDGSSPWFTISLSEPLNGFHYKLVAGVYHLPE